VIDDNRDGASTLVDLLRKRGHVVEVAFDGPAALARGGAFRPDLVMMDLGMPIMDGFETCRHMRSLAWGQRARIAAVSGWGQPQDRERSKDAGFDEHVIKPVEPHTIERMVQNTLRRSGATA
jgi:CheY-like chemotaxis protein